MKDFEHATDTSLAERSQSPQHGTPDPHSLGAKREGLENVGTAAKAAIDEHRDTVADLGHHLRQRLDGPARGFRGSSPVVRYEYPIKTVLDGKSPSTADVEVQSPNPVISQIAQPSVIPQAAAARFRPWTVRRNVTAGAGASGLAATPGPA